jgi:two-component system LytT family response regulator
MIKAIIIDDEEHARLNLKSKLNDYCPSVDITGMADGAEEGYKLIHEVKPDLVFLDVAMPGESGFDMLQRMDKLDFEIIFVTGFDSYAIDAISFCAIGYILKPIQTEILIKSVHNAEQRIRNRRASERNQQLLENLRQPGHTSNKIGVPTETGLEFVPTKDIIRCEGQQKLTKIILSNDTHLYSSYNIGEFIRLLEPYGFFPIHRSHLVNLNRITKYNRDGMVTMEDGSVAPVSKRRRTEFLKQLTRV